jgi:hypothetical protein
MSEPKFTKGPLTIRENRDGYIIDASDVCALAEVYGHDEEGLANARIYAAAPDMYEALKEITGFFESGEFVRDTSRDFEQGWHLKMLSVVKSLADAQAAIDKADKEG